MAIQEKRHYLDQRGIGIATKVVMVCALGFIVVVAYHSRIAPAEGFVAPAETPATGATSFVAPFEATAMSADGRGGGAPQ